MIQTKVTDEVYLTEPEAAQLSGFSPAWFRRMRWSGGGPIFVRVGRSIRYPKIKLLSWLAEREVTSTSAVGG